MADFKAFCFKYLTRRYGREAESEELLDLFMEGRSKSTIRQYSNSFNRWSKFLKEKDLLSRKWDAMLVCKYLRELERNRAGEGAVNQFCAMFGILKDVQGKESCLKGPFVIQVRKAIVKRINMKKERKGRQAMKKKHMRKMIQEMYRRKRISEEEMRLLTIIACMFFCVKRFSDVIGWKWENLERKREGGWKIIQESSKTDQLRKGIIINVPGALDNKVGPSEILDWYHRKLARPKVGYVFCSFRASKQRKLPEFAKAVGYDTIRKAFKKKLKEFGLPELDLHSCRIGGATESSRMGVSREVIKLVGNWRSSAVDTYIRPEEPMELVVDVLTR